MSIIEAVFGTILKRIISREFDMRMEKYKSAIRNYEFIFSSKVEAMRELTSISFEVNPIKQYPDDEDDTINEIVALKLKTIGEMVKKFYIKSSPVLSEQMALHITQIIDLCDQNHWSERVENIFPQEREVKAAESVRKLTVDVLNMLRNEIIESTKL